MPTANTPFARWLWDWLSSHEYTYDRLASMMGNTGPMVSKWVNGQTVPDAKNLLKLSEIVGLSHWELAALAWDWPAVPETDDTLKDHDTRQMARMFETIKERSPEMAEDLMEVAQTLQKRARARDKHGRGSGSD
jgi:transcriptional regulator with XRE-family HTH domain